MTSDKLYVVLRGVASGACAAYRGLGSRLHYLGTWPSKDNAEQAAVTLHATYAPGVVPKVVEVPGATGPIDPHVPNARAPRFTPGPMPALTLTSRQRHVLGHKVMLAAGTSVSEAFGWRHHTDVPGWARHVVQMLKDEEPVAQAALRCALKDPEWVAALETVIRLSDGPERVRAWVRAHVERGP